MSVEDRREHILEAVIPLLRAQGSDVTTRDIAEAAGIAEGTIFRAFSDKDELIDQAVVRFLDPEPVFVALESIDPALSLEAKVCAAVTIYRNRFSGVVGIMSALGHRGSAHKHQREPLAEERARDIFARVFAPDVDRLRIDAAMAVYLIRLLSFGTSIPMFTAEREMETDALVDFIMRGIVKEGH